MIKSFELPYGHLTEKEILVPNNSQPLTIMVLNNTPGIWIGIEDGPSELVTAVVTCVEDGKEATPHYVGKYVGSVVLRDRFVKHYFMRVK